LHPLVSDAGDVFNAAHRARGGLAPNFKKKTSMNVAVIPIILGTLKHE